MPDFEELDNRLSARADLSRDEKLDLILDTMNAILEVAIGVKDAVEPTLEGLKRSPLFKMIGGVK